MEIVTSIASISEINQAIEIWYSNTDIDKAISEYAKDGMRIVLEKGVSGREDVNSAPIVRLVNSILEEAV